MPMSRLPRIVILTVVGTVGVIVLVVAAVLFLVDASMYKTRLEAATSAALGMDFSVGGRVSLAFFPGVLVTLADVHIRRLGADVATAKEASLAIDLRPLLRKEARVRKLVLKHAMISIERGHDGRFNVEPAEADEADLPTLDWPNVSLSDAAFVYADKRLGRKFEAEGCRVDVHGLRLSGGRRATFMKDLLFTAELACGEFRSGGFTASDLKLSVDAKNGRLDLKPVTARVFGTQGSGSIQAEYAGAVALYHVHCSLLQFPVEEFFKTMSMQNLATGRMDFSANLSLQGKAEKEIRQSATGQISLRGKTLTLSGTDLDREFARFESSQNFNLVDVGAFFFAGPLGLVVTKGVNFASIAQGTGGSSEIRTLVSDWKVEHGVAQAQDVAMATKENRIALQGGLDFVNNQFSDVTIALIDAKGCAKVRQRIRGSFQDPVVEQPSLLQSLAGPALRLLKKGRDILGGGECGVFYAGSVAAPK